MIRFTYLVIPGFAYFLRLSPSLLIMQKVSPSAQYTISNLLKIMPPYSCRFLKYVGLFSLRQIFPKTRIPITRQWIRNALSCRRRRYWRQTCAHLPATVSIFSAREQHVKRFKTLPFRFCFVSRLFVENVCTNTWGAMWLFEFPAKFVPGCLPTIIVVKSVLYGPFCTANI